MFLATHSFTMKIQWPSVAFFFIFFFNSSFNCGSVNRSFEVSERQSILEITADKHLVHCWLIRLKMLLNWLQFWFCYTFFLLYCSSDLSDSSYSLSDLVFGSEVIVSVEVRSNVTFLVLDGWLDLEVTYVYMLSIWTGCNLLFSLHSHSTYTFLHIHRRCSPYDPVLLIWLELINLRNVISFAISMLLLYWSPLYVLSLLWWMLHERDSDQQFEFSVASCLCFPVIVLVE